LVRQLLLRQGHAEATETLYRKALSIAQDQEAKLWELRAAASLARLWRDQGRRPEACDLLAPVYGWFTEGFDTPDLKEAKALIVCRLSAGGRWIRTLGPPVEDGAWACSGGATASSGGPIEVRT
jgi:predicted ATPase